MTCQPSQQQQLLLREQGMPYLLQLQHMQILAPAFMQAHVVQLLSSSIGNSCRVSCACRGAAPAWHLSHVEVSNHSTGARAVFYANAWLDVKLGTTTLLLTAGSSEGQQGTAQNKWKLSVQTRYVG
jgi:hypothetical protein